MTNNKIKFQDLSLWIKIAIIGGWAGSLFILICLISILIGIIEGFFF